jgi:hypothetical protein
VLHYSLLGSVGFGTWRRSDGLVLCLSLGFESKHVHGVELKPRSRKRAAAMHGGLQFVVVGRQRLLLSQPQERRKCKKARARRAGRARRHRHMEKDKRLYSRSAKKLPSQTR